MKKISTRRCLFNKVVDDTGTAFLALLLIFLWQLYRGPIAVPFLKPYIIKALNHDDAEYQVTLDSVNIELVRSIQPIKIIANNVTYRKNDETFVVTAPKTSVSFSIRALLHGVVAPSSIEVNRPPKTSIAKNWNIILKALKNLSSVLTPKTGLIPKAILMISGLTMPKWNSMKSNWAANGFSRI